MRKIMTLMVFGLFLISMAGVVSAQTVVLGTVYNEDYTGNIGDANVTVACTDGNYTNYRYTTSSTDVSNLGDYFVSFNETGADKCKGGDSVTVTVTKGDLIGSETETVVDEAVLGLDIAIINVSIVPEFGLFMGILTLVSAVGIFAFVRRD